MTAEISADLSRLYCGRLGYLPMVSNVELYDDLNDPTTTRRTSGNALKRWWRGAICPRMPAVIADNRRLDRGRALRTGVRERLRPRF